MFASFYVYELKGVSLNKRNHLCYCFYKRFIILPEKKTLGARYCPTLFSRQRATARTWDLLVHPGVGHSPRADHRHPRVPRAHGRSLTAVASIDISGMAATAGPRVTLHVYAGPVWHTPWQFDCLGPIAPRNRDLVTVDVNGDVHPRVDAADAGRRAAWNVASAASHAPVEVVESTTGQT